MTVQELYDWAKKNRVLDKTIAKNCNLEVHDIESVHYVKNEFAKIFFIDDDRVVLD